MSNVQYCAFHKHTCKKLLLRAPSALPETATCNQAAHGSAIVKCPYPACNTGVTVLEETAPLGFKGWIKSSLENLNAW